MFSRPPADDVIPGFREPPMFVGSFQVHIKEVPDFGTWWGLASRDSGENAALLLSLGSL